MVKILSILLLTVWMFGNNHLHEFDNKDFRPGGMDNICRQTAEYFDGQWYPLTYSQQKEAKKLKLSLYNKHSIIFGGILCEYIDKEGELHVYKGMSRKHGVVLIMIDPIERDVINIKIGDLHMKEFKCRPKRQYIKALK